MGHCTDQPRRQVACISSWFLLSIANLRFLIYSGGPLLASDGTVIGIVSWGFGCGEPNYPGVYSKVSSATTFIRNGVCELSSTPPSYCSLQGRSQCFSDRATVQVKGQGETRMDQLKVGNEVLAADGVSYTKVYSFGHLDRNREAEFLQIHTSGSNPPIEVTADHLLFVQNVGPVPANEVKAGHLLMASGQNAPARVVSIEKVQRNGIYSPFTASGDALVNGIATSNYISLPAAFQPHMTFEQQIWLQHFAYAPFRYYCSLADCHERTFNDVETGLFSGVLFWLPLLRGMEAQHPLVLSGILFGIVNMTRFAVVLLGFCFLKKMVTSRGTTFDKSRVTQCRKSKSA